MSLVIYVSQKTVIISKYSLEFRFSPPSPNLSNAALGAYELLRQSEILQTESTRDQKDEVITLLKQYGLALFNAVIPEHIRSLVYKAGGIFIYSLDQEVINLPWELLYDGSSFFALTQGIIRINQSKTDLSPASSDYTFPHLTLALNSHLPLQPQKTGWAFCAQVENIAVNAIPRSPLIELKINGDASQSSIITALEKSPQILFFSGFDTENGWLLKGSENESGGNTWLSEQFKPKLRQAVEAGLKMVILQTSNLLESPDNSTQQPQNLFFDCGVPFLITVQGRLAGNRLNEYIRVLFLGLIREENISKAHRLAINHIQSSVPLSWDWSWIRFQINQKLLATPSEQPLPPFHFDRIVEKDQEKLASPLPFKDFLPARRFFGNISVLERFIEQMQQENRHQVIALDISKGQPAESYIGEWLRRSAAERSTCIVNLYYQKWGFQAKTVSRLSDSKFSRFFSFLSRRDLQSDYFEQSLFHLSSIQPAEADLKVLIIYTPPEKEDREFDRWLQQKLKDDWQIIFLHDRETGTSLKTTPFDLGIIDISQIINKFEDGLPGNWIGLVEDKLPNCMKDITLLSMIRQSRNTYLINLLKESPSLDFLYQTTVQSILDSLSTNRLRLFTTLYLLRIACPKFFLDDLLEIKEIEAELHYLYDLHLIEANLSFEYFWIAGHLRSRLQHQNLIPENIILAQGQEILQQMIATQDDQLSSLRYAETGFQYCLLQMVELGQLEYPLQRNLQIGKKLARRFPSEFRHTENIVTSMELALQTQKGHLIQKTLFSLVEVLEQLPYKQETINLCEWLLNLERKHRNWPLVSEMQTRIASIYTALDKKEKAIGLISSALKLNNDIKNFSSRYRNVVSIALLLLDLGEFDKLSKLLTSADFDMSLLNKEDMTKLWLIDGHMLFHNGRIKEAESSFCKVINNPSLNVSAGLMAKTHLHLASIYRDQDNWHLYYQHLERAVHFIQENGEKEKAAELHEELYELSLSNNDFEKAVKHLEWTYRFYREKGNKTQIRKAADLLGGLYFKIGEHSKSTELYSIAQGI